MKTKSLGQKTQSKVGRHSPLTIYNKHDDYDYCFRSRKEIEEGGGEDAYGWQPINEANNNGEVSGGPLESITRNKTKGNKQIVYIDTIACRRPKEVGQYFKSLEDEKYNAQVKFVRDAAKDARIHLRNADQQSFVNEDKSSFKGTGMTQRVGKTEKLENYNEGEDNGK